MARIYEFPSKADRLRSPWGKEALRAKGLADGLNRRAQALKNFAGLGLLLALMGLAALYYSGAPLPGVQNSFLTASTDTNASVNRTFPVCGNRSRVNCIVDGDTLYIDGEKIRVSGFNTPELFSPQCAREAELARRAQRHFQQLLNEGPFEVRRTLLRDEDAYGRKLRRLYRNGKPIGDQLIAEGLAHRWRGYKQSWCS